MEVLNDLQPQITPVLPTQPPTWRSPTLHSSHSVLKQTEERNG